MRDRRWDVQGLRDRRVEADEQCACTRMAPRNRCRSARARRGTSRAPPSAARCAPRPIPDAARSSGRSRRATPCGMSIAGMATRARRRAAPRACPGRPGRSPSLRRAAIVAPSAATNTSPSSPMPRSTQHDRRRERLRAGGPRRVADADDVAADVRRQEVVEERRDQVRVDQRAERHRDVLRAQQQRPAPGADQDHRRSTAPARRAARDRRRARERPEPRESTRAAGCRAARR